jgi:flagellar basal-body rod protein FlgG
MLRALSTASSGMEAQQILIDNVANNLANVNTAGFKKARAEFEDLLYTRVTTFGGSDNTDGELPLVSQVGHGVRLAGLRKVFAQGNTRQTESSMDMMIDGDGFFQIQLPDGTVAFTRDGGFNLDGDGNMVKASGYLLEPSISLPDETRQLTVAGDGTMSAVIAGDPTPQSLGQIELVRFVNPAGLEAVGHNLYRETVASGPPVPGSPGEDGLGSIVSGYVELSNVNVIEEMISMITAQRAYELNSKSIQTADEMLQGMIQLKR